MKFLKVALLLVTICNSFVATAGGADAGGLPRNLEVLKGDKFSFTCKLSVVTGSISYVEEVQLTNEFNEFDPSLKNKGIYIDRWTGDQLSTEELASQLVNMEGSAMREFLDPEIRVYNTGSPSEFRLYIQGKMKGYSTLPFLTTSQSFTVDSKKIEAELIVSHGYTTEEYGLKISCVNNR